MGTIQPLLEKKGNAVFAVGPNDSVSDALRRMAEFDVGALIVIDGEELVGIVTERDYARKVYLKGRASPTIQVKDIMTTKVFYVQPDQSVEECMAIMTKKKIRHLPVLSGERLIGVISIGDLVESIITNQKFMIEQLEHFIHGQRS